MSGHRSIYLQDQDESIIKALINRSIVSNYGQAVRLCLSIVSDYFSDEQLHAEASIRLTDKRYKENKKNE